MNIDRALLDPAADRLYIISTLLAFVLRDIVPWWFVALLLALGFGYDTVEAVTNLQQLPLLYIGSDIAAAILEEGHTEAAFIIVGSGPNGADPHHEFSDRVIERSDIVVIDIGGPVEPGRGFVLHSVGESADEDEGMMRIGGGGLAMTTTRNILEDIARGRGPDRAVLSLGYAGWEAGQLENEMLANGWLTADAGDELIFGTDNAGKWQAALKSLGVDPLMLSAAAGHA